MDAIVTVSIEGTVQSIVANFTQWLKNKGIIVYVVVNHAEDMRARGVEPPVEGWTVVFGNPVLGAGFLSDTPEAVVDIPLRLGFYQKTPERTVVVRRLMQELLSDYGNEALVTKSQKVDGLIDQWLANMT